VPWMRMGLGPSGIGGWGGWAVRCCGRCGSVRRCACRRWPRAATRCCGSSGSSVPGQPGGQHGRDRDADPSGAALRGAGGGAAPVGDPGHHRAAFLRPDGAQEGLHGTPTRNARWHPSLDHRAGVPHAEERRRAGRGLAARRGPTRRQPGGGRADRRPAHRPAHARPRRRHRPADQRRRRAGRPARAARPQPLPPGPHRRSRQPSSTHHPRLLRLDRRTPGRLLRIPLQGIKGDKPPGPKTIARGRTRLDDRIKGWHLARSADVRLP
jgi:hypothetical protein